MACYCDETGLKRKLVVVALFLYGPRAGVWLDDGQSCDPHTPCDDVADMECGHYERVGFKVVAFGSI